MIITQDCQDDSIIIKKIQKIQIVNETHNVEIQQRDQQQQFVQEQKEVFKQEEGQIQNELQASNGLQQQEDKLKAVAEQPKEYSQQEENLRTLNLQQLEKQPKYMNIANFSDKCFHDISLCETTLKALEKMNVTKMTNIQARIIPHLLKGRDVLGVANAGSGKTLGYLISALELLYKNKFYQKNGTGIIIVTPTGKLAQQIFDFVKDLLFYHENTRVLITGSTDIKEEAIKLKEGVKILIAAPDRLKYHLQNTKEFIYHNLLCLIIDEADQLLKHGYEVEIYEILKLLPRERQTLLFSTTRNKSIDDLARISLNQPAYIGNDDDMNQGATNSDLKQGYLIVEPDRKFLLLYSFLQLNLEKKIMVFMQSSNSVKFHAELLYLVDMPVFDIHGKQKQSIRTNTYYNFCDAEKGVLLCTDVAVRGLDIPDVN
ncbi:unnamed protein product [Paramecium octaurelia]|uniref:ATP-dependent RNA helicase n=1 Tax=Paramecium octaurelia TaxID=43137 RepID=A0A8S1WTM0_PAROT|nr:unnamed protein product [Paramecium octaurelia]